MHCRTPDRYCYVMPFRCLYLVSIIGQISGIRDANRDVNMPGRETFSALDSLHTPICRRRWGPVAPERDIVKEPCRRQAVSDDVRTQLVET